MRKKVTYILELLDIEEQGTEFCFRKLKFITIYNGYSNKSPFKYYISILGGWGVQNSGKPAYMILARSLMDEKKQDKSLTKSSQVSQILVQ